MCQHFVPITTKKANMPIRAGSTENNTNLLTFEPYVLVCKSHMQNNLEIIVRKQKVTKFYIRVPGFNIPSPVSCRRLYNIGKNRKRYLYLFKKQIGLYIMIVHEAIHRFAFVKEVIGTRSRHGVR